VTYISERLMKIADFVPNNTVVADIGADHGKLLVSLAEQGKIISGIAGELNEGPWKNATNFVRKAGFDDVIDVRLGNGLAVIQEQVDVIVIAGMGGALIASILEAGQEKLTGVSRLILQANIGEHRVREWLDTHQWSLVAEEIVCEDNIYYEILVAEPSIVSDPAYEQLPLSKEFFYQIGPLLWRDHHPLLLPKLRLSLQRKREVVEQLAEAKVASGLSKLGQVQRELANVEQVIQWLLAEKH
jgi:tRNA (adenine22-N1)-methyltransferase